MEGGIITLVNITVKEFVDGYIEREEKIGLSVADMFLHLNLLLGFVGIVLLFFLILKYSQNDKKENFMIISIVSLFLVVTLTIDEVKPYFYSKSEENYFYKAIAKNDIQYIILNNQDYFIFKNKFTIVDTALTEKGMKVTTSIGKTYLIEDEDKYETIKKSRYLYLGSIKESKDKVRLNDFLSFVFSEELREDNDAV